MKRRETHQVLFLLPQEARVGGKGLDAVAERGEAFDQVPHEVVPLGVRLFEETVLQELLGARARRGVLL